MFFLQANWIFAFVCAFTYYGMGKAEARDGSRNNGLLWAGLSIAISALLIQIFGTGWFSLLLAQIGLFIGITIFRTFRDS